VGDSERDIQAAQRAGAQAVLVRTGNGKATEARWRNGDGKAIAAVFDDLAAFTDHWLAQRG
jgi:D-glycero-D-manno-heptose 1,7-bisphosphate phosphatase